MDVNEWHNSFAAGKNLQVPSNLKSTLKQKWSHLIVLRFQISTAKTELKVLHHLSMTTRRRVVELSKTTTELQLYCYTVCFLKEVEIRNFEMCQYERSKARQCLYQVNSIIEDKYHQSETYESPLWKCLPLKKMYTFLWWIYKLTAHLWSTPSIMSYYFPEALWSLQREKEKKKSFPFEKLTSGDLILKRYP